MKKIFFFMLFMIFSFQSAMCMDEPDKTKQPTRSAKQTPKSGGNPRNKPSAAVDRANNMCVEFGPSGLFAFYYLPSSSAPTKQKDSH